MNISLSERIKNFQDRVGQPDENGCMNWLGNLTELGYGSAKLTVNKIKYGSAHRVAYFLEYGEFDINMHVLHTCDNPKCVNPEHLWLGTHADNMKDMANKGRAKSGMEGKKHSSTTKQKMSESSTGKISPMKGKKLTSETKRKISEAHIGKIMSVESRIKMSTAKIGTKQTEETKVKISNASKKMWEKRRKNVNCI